MNSDTINIFSKYNPLRIVQSSALQSGLLTNRLNYIVSAPTNSGKSMLGWLVLLQAIQQGKRAILLEPLRALAQEKRDEISRLAPAISDALGKLLNIRISTGDYRNDDETFFDSAPEGELIIATPERLEALLRNPDNQAWLETIGAVCVDEAHLICSPRRGPTLEYLLTSLLCQPAPPRIILLSATLGNLDRAKEWLAPCEVVKVTERYPALHKGILEVKDGEDANQTVSTWLAESLQAPANQALVFVYQTRAAEGLAKGLTEQLGSLAGTDGALSYHSRMSVAEKERVRQSFTEGRSRVVVTTTALAMGINLPATHVVVRDLTFPGAESPTLSDLMQMMGRAGRGDQEGHAVVVHRPTDAWTVESLQQALDEEVLPDFVSAFTPREDRFQRAELSPAIPLVASLLSRNENGSTKEGLETFLQRSLGGQHLISEVPTALRWLESHSLAHQEERLHRLTVLGREATRAVLPLPLAAGYGQLIRDILTVDPDDEILARWRPLDHLLLLTLLHDRSFTLRRHSKQLDEIVDGWLESHSDEAPALYKWIRGQDGHSKADEILGSIGVKVEATGSKVAEQCRKVAYQALFHAIVLFTRSQGKSIRHIEQEFGIKGLEGIEEQWRDNFLWLLSGLARILTTRAFFFHLKQECNADLARIRRVERAFQRMRHQVFDLLDDLKYCSPLGSLLRDIRRHAPKKGRKMGVQSIRRLEQAGIGSLKDLVGKDSGQLVKLGLQRQMADQVVGYLKRRSV